MCVRPNATTQTVGATSESPSVSTPRRLSIKLLADTINRALLQIIAVCTGLCVECLTAYWCFVILIFFCLLVPSAVYQHLSEDFISRAVRER